jgi:hypothetical protein
LVLSSNCPPGCTLKPPMELKWKIWH